MRRILARNIVILLQTHYALLKRERILYMILLEVKSITMVMIGGIIEVGGRSNQGDHDERNNLYCKICDRRGHEANIYLTPWDKIK